MPFFQRIVFWYAWYGFRGSQFFWRLFKLESSSLEMTKVRLPNGFPIVVNQKDWTAKTIYQGTYERPLLRLLDALNLQNLVIDVGANIGVTLWHSMFNSNQDAKYLAFEPSKQCFESLSFVCSDLNRVGSIFSFALGNRSETKIIYGVHNKSHSGGASLIPHYGLKGNSESVQVQTLDDVLINEISTTNVSLLKIDTEGYEMYVIEGARNLLRSQVVEILIIEISPNFGDIKYLNVLNELLGERYNWFSLGEEGSIKRYPILRRIHLSAALNKTEQWNLVLVREDVLQRYLNANHQIFSSATHEQRYKR
jgi:FkbM family methyltransferase